MHDEPLNQNDLSPTACERLDKRLTRALETVPTLQIPADFASRVASRVPARRPVSLTPTYYGYTAILIGMLVTLVALLVVAAHAGRATIGLPESFLFAQFIALAVWFGVRRHSLR
jgi:hypothetical protein